MIGSIINGQEYNDSQNTMDVLNPYTREKEAEIALASKTEFEQAVTNHLTHSTTR